MRMKMFSMAFAIACFSGGAFAQYPQQYPDQQYHPQPSQYGQRYAYPPQGQPPPPTSYYPPAPEQYAQPAQSGYPGNSQGYPQPQQPPQQAYNEQSEPYTPPSPPPVYQPQYNQTPPDAPPPQLPPGRLNQNGYQNTGRPMSLEQKLALRNQNGMHGSKTVMKVAVGDKDNANATEAFPAIGQPRSLSLVADPSVGSFQSATGVCLGLDAAALVQYDAATVRAHTSDDDVPSPNPMEPQSCLPEMHYEGSLYADYGYLIVRADNDYSSMHQLLVDHPSKHKVSIAVGMKGSGGEITLRYLLNSDKSWHDAVGSVENYMAGEEALDALANGQVDAYFVMEPMKSHFIDDIVNTYNGGGKFKLLPINPYDKFFATTDGNRKHPHLMYRATKFPGAHWYSGNTATITVDVAVITNSRFRAANHAAIEAFRRTLANSKADVRDATGTPQDWQPATRNPN